MTFSHATDIYIDTYIKVYRRNYQPDLSRLRKMVDRIPKLTDENIDLFFQQLEGTPATRNRYRSLMKHFLKWSNGRSDFPRSLKMERELNQRNTRLPKDRDRLEECLIMCGLYPLYVAAIDTGVRRGALCQLHHTDIDFPNQTLIVPGKYQKNGKAQNIPMTERLMSTIPLYCSIDHPLFPWSQKSWNWVRKSCGLKHLRWHDLRHEFGLRLLEKNVPLPTIQRLLGHSQITTTMRYLNTENTEKADKEAIDALY